MGMIDWFIMGLFFTAFSILYWAGELTNCLKKVLRFFEYVADHDR